MIVDIMRIPTDEDGNLLYDIEEVESMLELYSKTFPEHQVIAMPDKLKVWEDIDIDSLKSIRKYLDELITSKEIEENDL
jgi:hypothetical protein